MSLVRFFIDLTKRRHQFQQGVAFGLVHDQQGVGMLADPRAVRSIVNHIALDQVLKSTTLKPLMHRQSFFLP